MTDDAPRQRDPTEQIGRNENHDHPEREHQILLHGTKRLWSEADGIRRARHIPNSSEAERAADFECAA